MLHTRGWESKRSLSQNFPCRLAQLLLRRGIDDLMQRAAGTPKFLIHDRVFGAPFVQVVFAPRVANDRSMKFNVVRRDVVLKREFGAVHQAYRLLPIFGKSMDAALRPQAKEC